MKDGKTETQRPARLPGLNGGIARYFAGRVRTARLIYNLLLFVWLSFLIMGVVTYVFIDKIMRQQLWESAENALSHTQVTMAADLAEPAVLLTGFAEGVRHRLLLGSDPQSMHDSVRDIAAAIRATSRKLATSSLYGWFEAYGGLFLYDGYGVPAIDYTPQQSPWYAAAIAANGAVAATQPYIGPRLQGFVMSYARRVFDEAARPLAILALDVSLDTIRQYVVETRIAEDGFGLLLDAQLNVIVHPDASLVGKAFQDINPDAPVIADILASGADVREHEMTTHRGEPAVVFFRQLANGWRLGIVTPIDVYYRMAGAMKRFLFTLGFLLAAALSAVLLHIAHARESAIAQTRIMFDGLPIGANLFSRQARNINCNQEAVRLFRAQDKETYLARYLELSPEHQPCGASSLEKGHEWLTKAFDEGYCRFEWVHRTLDGEPLPCEITLVRLVYQEEFVVAGYALDLRELKATMARIADESARFENMAHWYESILAAIPFPVSVQDMQARWTFVNVAFEKLLGKTRKEILGLPCNIWNIDICNTPDCAIECAKRGERQTRFSHTDASYQVDVEVLRNLHGDTTGFIEVVQDISQLEQMAARQMEAESVSRAKSAFLAVVSHEIRTPMNAILGITEIQLQNTALSSDTTEVFSKIYTAGYTLLGIINDILDLSRMEAGKVELVPAKYEVASLLIDTAQLNMVRIGSKPIAFRLQVDEHIPSALFGDDLRIKQILNNLLSNAFKYTLSGAVTLSVSVEYGEAGEEDSRLTLVCRVSDTGLGMTAEQVDRLFDEYSRFYLEANRAIEGIGLGMTITRQLVQLMEGEILVESEPGKGSTFTVRLPQDHIGADRLGRELAESLQQFKATPHLKVAHIIREPMPYGSVLIVDDLETNLYVSRGLMAPYGLSIDTAMSGFEAIEKIRNGCEYDLVFMDHMMPGMDGVEATKILRDMGYTRPIVALTANAVVGQADMFMENGFNAFISKPVDLRQLNALLNRMVRDKQPPEVIEAARRQYNATRVDSRETRPTVDPQLASIFVRDAGRVAAALEAMHINQYRRDDDVQLFVVNVHAMKSALANIGEAESALLAHKLEQAGRKKDIAAMSQETPDFLDALREAIAKFAQREEEAGNGMEDGDLAYLREKLLAIHAACAAYDKKAAKDALAALRQKAWPRSIREQVDAIAGHLLHSDFAEAVALAEMIGRTL